MVSSEAIASRTPKRVTRAARRAGRGGGSHLERAMETQLRVAGYPEPERELRFHPVRRWRFDFAWPDHMLALEVEGGTWGVGRHTSGKGFESDCEKYNTATAHGWRVLRVTSGQIRTGAALQFVEMALMGAGQASSGADDASSVDASSTADAPCTDDLFSGTGDASGTVDASS